MRFALVSVVINTVLGAGLFFWFSSLGGYGYPGLAIATSIAAWANALLLAFGLAKRGWYRPGPALISRLIRASLATGAMSWVLWLALQHVALIRAHIYDSKLEIALIIIFASMVAYALAALIFGAVRPRELINALKRD